MLGEILGTIGLVVSGQGLIGSIRLENAVRDLGSRLRDAENLLVSLTDDTQFLRTALESLMVFDSNLAESEARPVLEVKYMASENSLRLFLAHPERFGGEPHPSLGAAIERVSAEWSAGQPGEDHDLPVVVAHDRARVAAFTVPRCRLDQEDVFGAVPLDTFDPGTVEQLASFLSDVEMARQPGDQFDVQFEEEK